MWPMMLSQLLLNAAKFSNPSEAEVWDAALCLGEMLIKRQLTKPQEIKRVNITWYSFFG